MHVQSIVRRILLEASPQMHASRRTALVSAVTSALDGAALSVTSLGRSMRGEAYEKHRIKRADRLVSNHHLYGERVTMYTVLAQVVLGGTLRPIISVDWSNMDRGKTRYLLRASVALDGRSFTLYEEVHSRAQFMKPSVERQFLSRLGGVVGSLRRPIIVTDAGYLNPWRRAVLALGWDFIGRVRGRVMLARADAQDWEQARALFHQATGNAKVLDKRRLSRDQPLDCAFVLVAQARRGRHDPNCYGRRAKGHYSNNQARSQREPWLLATSLDLSRRGAVKRVLRAYKTRMQIEESFRDLKSVRFGLGFEASRAKVMHRIELLLLIALVALYAAWLIGLCVQGADHHRRYQANTVRKRRVLSFVYLGRRAWRDTQLRMTIIEYRNAIDSIRDSIENHAVGF